ncbi:MAG: CBS domain-containing protein [Candidatus Omnitrophica bacterium]|nr:CBS domain-containing protein [Candidatus Omnitrophota bacterium]
MKEKLKKQLEGIKAVDIMSKYAITIKEDEKIMKLAHLMMRFKISGVPVVKDNGEICGIVTSTDLLNIMKKITSDIQNYAEIEDFADMNATAFMTKDVVTITEETNLFEIMKIMCEKNVHTLPVMVIEDKEISGVIGKRDILNAFYGFPKV